MPCPGTRTGTKSLRDSARWWYSAPQIAGFMCNHNLAPNRIFWGLGNAKKRGYLSTLHRKEGNYEPKPHGLGAELNGSRMSSLL
ncbi:Protein of unknown function [Pyronema omphalodes CBS 100304]|uniref:Uncharacterized protein n=1 Tax=Pyronema omphalodes (strain CBS 100304) TaxID=1076935 RepID=U4LMW9_PYROM|nr:Protein of unknown function [Pyronema omphalodes CBS 100304]